MPPSPTAIKYAFLGGVTAAELAAEVGPANAPLCYVSEFDAWYQWTAGSAVAADGYRVIAATGGVAGRWILASSGIRLAPSLGATWTRLGAARAAMARHGSITLAAEAWTADVEINWPNGSHEICEPGCTINSTIPLSPGAIPQNALWYNNGGTTAPTASTTLAANAAAGSLTFQLTSAVGFNIGGWFRIMEGVAYTRTYKIKNKVGNVITLDRPTRRPFTAGAAVQAIAGALDCTLEGNGVVVTGSADAILQTGSGVNIHFSGVNATWSGKFGISFDLGTRDSTIENVFIDGQGTLPSCFLFANNENMAMYDCIGVRAGFASAGIVLAVLSCDNVQGYGGSFTESDQTACELSVEDLTDLFGCRGCGFMGTYFGKAVGTAVRLLNGSSFNTFTNCDASDSQTGWSFTGGNGPANGNELVGCRADRNSQIGYSANASTINRTVGCSGTGNVVGFANVNGSADMEFLQPYVNDTSVVVASAGLIQVGASSIVRITDGYATTARNAMHFLQVAGAGALGEISGNFRYYVPAAANCALVLVSDGVVRLSGNVRVTSAGGFGVFLNGATAFARIGQDVDLSGAGTPLQISSGAANIGTFTLNGASPATASVAFGNTKSTDKIWVTRKTAGGTPGPQPTWVNTPGTGFALTGGNADQSVYEYRICA